MSTLLSFFTQSIKSEKKVLIAKTHAFECQQLYCRLNHVFSSLCETQSYPTFYTELPAGKKNPEIHFTFDNGIDPDPLFSGPIKGKVFIDTKNNLCLKLQPLQKKNSRTEVLYHNVHKAKWEFLTEANDKFPDKELQTISQNAVWRSLWPKKIEGFPSIIRLSFKESISQKEEKGENLKFAFFLPMEHPVVTYTEKKVL